jgi:hypothetical protein
MLFTPGTYLQLAQSQSSSILGTETIILNYEAGNYYELNELGGFIWSLLQINSVMSVAQIEQQVLQEFAVDESVCRAEVPMFLDSLYP